MHVAGALLISYFFHLKTELPQVSPAIEWLSVENSSEPISSAPKAAVAKMKTITHKIVPNKISTPTDKKANVESTQTQNEIASTGGSAHASSQVKEQYDAYVYEIAMELNRKKSYPALAQKLGQQGRITVQIKLDRSGKVIETIFLEESNFPSLNQATKKLIAGLDHFKPFPEHVTESSWLITVPIEYKL